MTIHSFIQNQVFLPRLQQHGVLIVYDPARRYRDLCLEIASETRIVVDAGGSSIEGRELAMATLQRMGQMDSQIEGMLVYVPAKPPLTDEQKQRDPFAVYTMCGAIFPNGGGDEYQSLCLRAKSDHATVIRRVFTDSPNPTFAVIDAIGGGQGWPNLQAVLKVESARDILFALLTPSGEQREALKSQDGCVTEAKDLSRIVTDHGFVLNTHLEAW